MAASGKRRTARGGQSGRGSGGTAAKGRGSGKRGGAGLSDLLTIDALTPADLERTLALAAEFKARPAKFATALKGKSVVMLFEKPSLRTRVSFEVGVVRLGGHALFYDHQAQRIGARESVRDYAKNLERWVHAIVARVYEQGTLTELAAHASVPVVNALSNEHHPCQALADLLTLRERWGKLAGKRVCFIGDGNNVATSLAQAGVLAGMIVTVITPPGYGLPEATEAKIRELAAAGGGELVISEDPGAVAGQQAVYTDEWASMHHADGAKRAKAFAGYQVNAGLMAKAARGALFMHCLPAQRGGEVTDEVIDAPTSVVYDQAENRMHAQNAVLMRLLAGK